MKYLSILLLLLVAVGCGKDKETPAKENKPNSPTLQDDTLGVKMHGAILHFPNERCEMPSVGSYDLTKAQIAELLERSNNATDPKEKKED